MEAGALFPSRGFGEPMRNAWEMEDGKAAGGRGNRIITAPENSISYLYNDRAKRSIAASRNPLAAIAGASFTRRSSQSVFRD